MSAATGAPARPGRAWIAQVAGRATPAVWALRLFVLVMTLGNAVWVLAERRGRPFDIDEAGYLGISATDWRGFGDGGVWGWYSAIVDQPVQAPLVPALSSLVFLGLGPQVLAAFVVPLAAYGVLGYCALALSRPYGLPCATICTVATCLTPVCLSYSRAYSFALPAAALLGLTLLAAVRSSGFSRWGWSIGWGAALGGMLLARTMTVAFAPGLVLVAVATAVLARSWMSVLKLLAGCATAVAVAALWYAKNLEGVVDYLRVYGYGSRARQYGAEQSALSPHDWLIYLRNAVNGYVFLGAGFVVVVGWLLGAGWLVARGVSDRGRALRSLRALPAPVMAGVVVVSGLAALVSSQNQGTAFVAPLVMPALLVASWGLTRSAAGAAGRLRGTLVAVAVVVLVAPAAAVTFLPLGRSTSRAAPVPFTASELYLFDSRGTLSHYEDDGLPLRSADQRRASAEQGAQWLAINEQIATVVNGRARHSGRPSVLAFTFRHRMLNPNSVRLQSLLGPNREVSTLMPEQTGDPDPASFVAQLDRTRAVSTYVLTASAGVNEILPALPAGIDTAIIQQWGLQQLAQYPLPDGRIATLWEQPAA